MNAPLKISVWEYTEANPGRKELIVENDTHWIASFNWDEGQDNPYTPTEKEARDNAQMLVAAQAMKEALESCLEVVGSWDEEPEWVLQAKQALTLANGKEINE